MFIAFPSRGAVRWLNLKFSAFDGSLSFKERTVAIGLKQILTRDRSEETARDRNQTAIAISSVF
ncbi:MAG: hypothetical protein SVX43_07935 [Cyanobacteriota bacterium]|nr:hypothetical protein [Cyanobacteriota bacterium]